MDVPTFVMNWECIYKPMLENSGGTVKTSMAEKAVTTFAAQGQATFSQTEMLFVAAIVFTIMLVTGLCVKMYLNQKQGE